MCDNTDQCVAVAVLCWLARKPIFNVKLRIESTIFSDDPALARFFAYTAANQTYAGTPDRLASVKPKLVSALNSLVKVPLGEQVRQLAPLLGRLMELTTAAAETDEVRQRAFQQLLRTLDAVATLDADSGADDGAMRIVAPYVRAVYGNDGVRNAATAPHVQLIAVLTNELRTGAEHLAAASRAIGPLLLLIYKSLCVFCELSGALKERKARADRFAPDFATQLGALFTHVRTTVAERSRTTVTVAKRLNGAFGRFSCQLLDVIDR